MAGEHGERTLPPDYVREHVELAYASTVHGAQGDTTVRAHLLVGQYTGAGSGYVGMTRGRTANTAHLVAADLDDARERAMVFARDRADLGPAHAAELADPGSGPLRPATSDRGGVRRAERAWTVEEDCLERLAGAQQRRELLTDVVALSRQRDATVPAFSARCRCRL